MNNRAFQNLMKKAKCDTGDDIETVGFIAKHLSYECNFFGDAVDDHKVTIDDFGKMYKKKWIQDTPSEEQLNIMQKMINKKRDNLI